MAEPGDVPKKKTVTDAELLSQVSDERRQSIGFDEDAVLLNARTKSLDYYKGVMPDVPHIEGRSKAVSTDVADAIETILPDLVEIFTTEDVVSFQAQGEEDEEAAEQETDYIKQVFFEDNSGFLILYSMIKDALQVKTGVAKVRSEDFDESEAFEGQSTPDAAAALMKYGDQMVDRVPSDENDLVNATWSYRIERKGKRAKVDSVDPADFTVSKDTVELRNTPYCAHRARKRVYELIASGLSREKVESLPSYGAQGDQQERARDTAGENDNANAGTGDRRLVEVVEHYVRQADGRYMRVLTGQDEKVLLEREDVVRHGFSAITPYIVAHRFYGESLSDKLMEIQRIRTALTRMALDNGYFALNGRSYIDMNKVNEWTISDLLNNAPNMPVRGNGEGAVTALGTASLNFDAFGALEYFSTQAEQRTGIVRGSQGLNPNSLHDTASGAIQLMSESQKRTRLIARILAETGIKDMFLDLHAVIRETASGKDKRKLRGKWVETDPTSWGSRSDMTIEIGMGASGKQAQALMLQEALGVVERIATGQGGPGAGPVVDWKNIYNLTDRYLVRGLGFKSSDGFINNPDDAPPAEEQQGPDPAVLELQAEQQKAAAMLEIDRQKAEQKAMLDREEAQAKAQLQREQNEADLMLQREKNRMEIEHLREKAALEYDLAQQKMRWDAQLSAAEIAADAANADTTVDGPHSGGDVG